MSKLAAAAKTDPELEANGVWAEYYSPDQTLFRVKLARAGTGNVAFVKYSEELTRGIRASGTDLARVSPEKSREIARKLYARCIVKDWNAEDFGIEFSEENAYAMFVEVDDFLNFCITEAQRISAYRATGLAVNAGN